MVTSVAHGGELGDVVAQPSFDDGFLGVVVGAEVAEAGCQDRRAGAR